MAQKFLRPRWMFIWIGRAYGKFCETSNRSYFRVEWCQCKSGKIWLICPKTWHSYIWRGKKWTFKCILFHFCSKRSRLAVFKHFPLFSAENYNFRISHFILERVLDEISHVIPSHPLSLGGRRTGGRGGYAGEMSRELKIVPMVSCFNRL